VPFRAGIPRLAAVALLALLAIVRAPAALAGPPFVTDDPVPTDYRNWEIYTGVEDDNEAGRTSSLTLPFAEFNYGAMPNVQVSCSFAYDRDAAAGEAGEAAVDGEFGIKTRLAEETHGRPQISFYPSVEFPGTAGAHAVTFLPVWLQKSAGAIAQVGDVHAVVFSAGRALHGATSFTSYAAYEFALGPR
jgi:hypothetical protein